ncbi:MAG: DUF362 domain-containing protein, partial [Clostridiales bacterium]|nr:DUF362 domain-containing protein [Clostridiales bacterium]
MVQSAVRTDYDGAAPDAAIARHFAALGVEGDLRPGMKVVLKPNLVLPLKPEGAATTHPSLLIAIARWLRDRGVTDITVADGPGGVHALAPLRAVYSACGMRQVAPYAKLNEDTRYVERTCEGGALRRFNLLRPIADADYIINVAKLKTHSMTVLSGGVKNLFGCLPGLQKPEMHMRLPDVDRFSQMLVDLALAIRPDITVIDAVWCMEGNGPTAGVRRDYGWTLASRDVFGQDAFAASLIGLDASSVPMLRRARAAGLLDQAIELAGDAPRPASPPFRLPDSAPIDFSGGLPGPLRRPANAAMNALLKPRPIVSRDLCVGCGRCAESC